MLVRVCESKNLFIILQVSPAEPKRFASFSTLGRFCQEQISNNPSALSQVLTVAVHLTRSLHIISLSKKWEQPFPCFSACWTLVHAAHLFVCSSKIDVLQHTTADGLMHHSGMSYATAAAGVSSAVQGWLYLQQQRLPFHTMDHRHASSVLGSLFLLKRRLSLS